MDSWIEQTSLSLDLNVGLPSTARRSSAPAAPIKVLVEENFLSFKKDHEVRGEIDSCDDIDENLIGNIEKKFD
jgi:hypothetical protein